MKKAEIIARYGEDAYAKHLAQKRAYYKEHKEEIKARRRKWREEHLEEVKAADKKYKEEHPEHVAANNKKYRKEHSAQVIANHQEECRKGGKYYDKTLKDKQTGLQGDRNKIRKKHARDYKPYKMLIAPDSQLHHEWIPKTDEYTGIALVEADAHMHGFVDVIEILDGEIAFLTEEEVKSGKKN